MTSSSGSRPCDARPAGRSERRADGAPPETSRYAWVGFPPPAARSPAPASWARLRHQRGPDRLRRSSASASWSSGSTSGWIPTSCIPVPYDVLSSGNLLSPLNRPRRARGGGSSCPIHPGGPPSRTAMQVTRVPLGGVLRFPCTVRRQESPRSVQRRVGWERTGRSVLGGAWPRGGSLQSPGNRLRGRNLRAARAHGPPQDPGILPRGMKIPLVSHGLRHSFDTSRVGMPRGNETGKGSWGWNSRLMGTRRCA